MSKIVYGSANGRDLRAIASTVAAIPKIKELLEECASKRVPKWLDVNTENGTAKVVTLPAREDIDFEINEQLIVEFYSK